MFDCGRRPAAFKKGSIFFFVVSTGILRSAQREEKDMGVVVFAYGAQSIMQIVRR